MNSFKNKALREAPVVGVKWAEQYTQTHSGQKLLTHTPKTVARFLGNEGRNTGLKDWRFIQTVDAIQKLFIMIAAPCLDKVDWVYWQSFAYTLPRSHTPLARDAPASNKQDKTNKGALAMIRSDCAPFLTGPYR